MAVEEIGETGGSLPPAELTVRVAVQMLPLAVHTFIRPGRCLKDHQKKVGVRA